MDKLHLRLKSIAARLRRDERGNVLIELALVMPIFATLAMGSYDLSRYAMETSRLDFAARAGAQVIIQNPGAISDLPGIEAEVVAAATVAAGPDVSDLVVTTSRVCNCPDGGGGTTTVACSTVICDDGSVMVNVLSVRAGHNVTPIFRIPGVIETRRVVGQFVVAF